MAFNKSGSRFITGSYDRTCKVWDTASGEELLTLEGHRNVVYAIAFNNPFGDKIATGSFDKTCKVSKYSCYPTVQVGRYVAKCSALSWTSAYISWPIQNARCVHMCIHARHK